MQRSVHSLGHSINRESDHHTHLFIASSFFPSADTSNEAPLSCSPLRNSEMSLGNR